MTNAAARALVRDWPIMRAERRKRYVAFALGVVVGWLSLGLAGLMLISGVAMIGQPRTARTMATEANMQTVRRMVENYQLDYGACPASLNALVPKYLPRIPNDGWKAPFVYAPSAAGAANPYTLVSPGPDGVLGTKDDIDVWALAP